jgi:uncharacterized protein YwqG
MEKKEKKTLISWIFLLIGIVFIVILYFFSRKSNAKSPLTGNTNLGGNSSNNSDSTTDLKVLLNNKLTEFNTEIQRITNNVSDIGTHVSEINSEVTTIKDTVTNISTRQGVLPVFKRIDLTPSQSQIVLSNIDPTKILDIERNGLTMDSRTEYVIEGNVLSLRDEAEENECIIIEYFN